MDGTVSKEHIKKVIVESLHLDGLEPETLEDDAPLFGGGLGLDSVDALELVVALEKEFGLKIPGEDIGEDVFGSVTSLTRFVRERMSAQGSESAG